MQTLIIILLLVLFPLLHSCSVGMAVSGKKQKDITVINEGAKRSFVHTEICTPSDSVQDKQGKWIDT